MTERLADQPTDEQLASQAKEGCANSFDLLVRRYQVPVLHFLQHRVGVTDAEDLTQDTFVCICRYLHRYRHKWPFRTWLFTIARHLSINHLRRRSQLALHEAVKAFVAALKIAETAVYLK